MLNLSAHVHSTPTYCFLYIFPLYAILFLCFLKAVLNCLAFFPLLTLLSVLTGKDSKLSISKDLMLKITLDNWLKGLKHAFPSISLS